MNTPAEIVKLPHMRDVSEWQGAIEWTIYRGEAREHDVVATYIRAGRGPGIVDERARENFAGAKRASGTRVGGYWYLTPGIGSPELQVDKLIAWSPRRPGRDLRPCLDCEAGSPAWTRSFIVAAIWHARRRLGYFPTIYGPSSYLHDLRLPAAFAACPLWIAELGVETPHVPAPWTHWIAWQHTFTAKDPSVKSTYVDDSYVADLGALTVPVRGLRRVVGGKI